MFFAVCCDVHAVTEDCSESKEHSLPELAKTVIEGSKDGYPELEEKKDFILKVIAKEEEQFNKTIDQGLAILAGYGSRDGEEWRESIFPEKMRLSFMILMDSRWI